MSFPVRRMLPPFSQTQHLAARFGGCVVSAQLSATIALGLPAAALVATTLTWTTTVQAQEEAAAPKKVLVGKLTGAKPTSARDWLTEGLTDAEGVEVVGGDDVDLEEGASADDIKSAANAVGADAVILGSSALVKGQGWTAKLVVYSAADGQKIDEIELIGGSWNEYRTALKNTGPLMQFIEQAQGAAPEETTAADLDEEAEAESEEVAVSASVSTADIVSSSEVGPSPLDARAGLALYSRSFRYTGTLRETFPAGGFGEPLTYQLDGAPMAFAEATWYPAAHFTGSWIANFGFTGSFDQGFGTQISYQSTAGPVTLDQAHTLWFAGAKVRFPFDLNHLALIAGVGNHTLEVSNDELLDPNGLPTFPDVSYSFIDVGAEGKLRSEKLLLGAFVKYRILTGVGDLGTSLWFPNVAGSGLTFGGEVGWRLTEMIDVIAGIETLQYGFDFNPIPPETEKDRVAGGATDRYLSAWLAVGIWLPGLGSSDAAAGEGGGGGDDFDSFDSFDDF